MNIPTTTPRPIIYPDSDGLPMSDNTLQFQYIVTIKEGLEAQFRHDPQVFIAGDLLWYSQEGHPEIRTAPDAMVAFGRPKGYRGSYRQWEEGGVTPQVVFEIWSPGNRLGDFLNKYRFYDKYGVEEFYLYDPDRGELRGYRRESGDLREIANMRGWVSPRLGVRFEMAEMELHLFHPDGERFMTFVEIVEDRDRARQQAARAEHSAQEERQRAELEQRAREQAQQRAEQERQRAEQERQRAEQERQRAERFLAQLRALGKEPPE